MTKDNSCAKSYFHFLRSDICEGTRLIISSLVTLLFLVVVFVGVIKEYSILRLYPAINFILLFACVIILAYVEALHFAVVSVEKWDMKQYESRFPRAIKCHALVGTPEKVKKFLVGRQFFVIFVVFVIAQITSFPGIPKDFLGLPRLVVIIFLEIGLPGVILTLVCGQLIGQIFVEEFTLQFLNLYGCELAIRLSLGAEWIGICNFSWLLYGTVSRVACRKVRKMQKSMMSINTTDELTEDPMSPTEKIRGSGFDTGLHSKKQLTWFDYLKYLWSTVVTLGSVFIICYGIYNKSYVLPTPPAASYIIALVVMITLFYLEGLMIAIVGTQYWDPEIFKDIYPRAYKIHKLITQPENVKRFIIGRQFFTVVTNFILAQIFTFANWNAGSANPYLFYIVFQSGLVGVFVILAFSQLLSELLAAEYPLRFMNLYGSYTIVYISLIFDIMGIGHGAWAFYYITRPFLCKGEMQGTRVSADTKPEIIRVESVEVLAKTAGLHNEKNIQSNV